MTGSVASRPLPSPSASSSIRAGSAGRGSGCRTVVPSPLRLFRRRIVSAPLRPVLSPLRLLRRPSVSDPRRPVARSPSASAAPVARPASAPIARLPSAPSAPSAGLHPRTRPPVADIDAAVREPIHRVRCAAAVRFVRGRRPLRPRPPSRSSTLPRLQLLGAARLHLPPSSAVLSAIPDLRPSLVLAHWKGGERLSASALPWCSVLLAPWRGGALLCSASVTVHVAIHVVSPLPSFVACCLLIISVVLAY